MFPENEAGDCKLKDEPEQSAVAGEDIEMTDDEKAVLNMLKDNSPIGLNAALNKIAFITRRIFEI